MSWSIGKRSMNCENRSHVENHSSQAVGGERREKPQPRMTHVNIGNPLLLLLLQRQLGLFLLRNPVIRLREEKAVLRQGGVESPAADEADYRGEEGGEKAAFVVVNKDCREVGTRRVSGARKEKSGREEEGEDELGRLRLSAGGKDCQYTRQRD